MIVNNSSLPTIIRMLKKIFIAGEYIVKSLEVTPALLNDRPVFDIRLITELHVFISSSP